MKKTIKFIVDGRPPRKYRGKSFWGTKQEAPLIRKLREKAFEARKKAKINSWFDGPVELELMLYAPNIFLINSKSHDHIGDLDAFISGICEASQPAHRTAPLHLVFKGINDEINPRRPLFFKNDSQVVSIKAKKIIKKKTYYALSIKGEIKK